MKILATMNPILFFDADKMMVTIEKSKPRVIIEKQYHCRTLKQKVTFVYGKRFDVKSFLTKRRKEETALPSSTRLILPSFEECHVTEISYLKSALQKCVRRMDIERALACSKSFMKCNMKSFLRRLVVIAAEDVYLDKNVLIVIWIYMMMTFNCFEPNQNHINWLLDYVHSLCCAKDYVDYGKEDTLISTGQCDSDGETMRLALKLFLNNTILMPDDARMLMWYHNHVEETLEKPAMKVDHVVELDKIGYIKVDDFPLEAIDFHTNSRMPEMINKRTKSTTENVQLCTSAIKGLIWRCRSGVNFRKPSLHDQEDEKIYSTIQNYVDDASKYILNKTKETKETKEKAQEAK